MATMCMAILVLVLFLVLGSSGEDITLLWGVNVIASVVGTVLTATSSMIIGFSGNLLIGAGLYLAALGCLQFGTKNIDKSRS